jgi:hypothetical protein
VSEGSIIRRQLKALEAKAELVDFIRGQCKTEGGRLNECGLLFMQMAKAGGWKQATVATILDITPGAVSQHFNR